MRIAVIDSGLGLLSTAAALRRACPEAGLVLSMDPDGMPWGPRPSSEIVELALKGARAAAAYTPDVLVVACNTASVHALGRLRAEFEPDVPVIGTVPAIKPAAATGGPVAVWATVATTGSAYQRDLIARFASGVEVTPVACPGLAEALERGARPEIATALERAAAATPESARAVVLGCTHYDLVANEIAALLPGHPHLFTAAEAVATQTLRRATTTAPGSALEAAATPSVSASASASASEADTRGDLIILTSGRPGALPPVTLDYPAGRELA
ncbi:MAG: glutamate racemase [Streptosporangiales bacterium]|nr:glutamate racemase [Streptosporangiales bacterium]